MTISERLVQLAASVSPSVKARVEEAHPSLTLVVKDGARSLAPGSKTDRAHTSWENLFPTEGTPTMRSRAPYDILERSDKTWLVRVYEPETGAVHAATGGSATEACDRLESRMKGAK